MNRKTILTIIAVLFIASFATLGISNLREQTNRLQLREIQLKDRTAELKKLELKYNNLNLELDKADKTNKAQIERLEREKQDLDKERQRLEGELQAKLQRKEQERIAAAQLRNNAVNAVTGTQTASAAAPARTSGSCIDIQNKLARLGVPADQLAAAGQLAMRESTCNEYVVNSIGACGAFQSLPCGKWGSPGTDEYYRGAIAYANSRYGGYNQALAHSLANNWY